MNDIQKAPSAMLDELILRQLQRKLDAGEDISAAEITAIVKRLRTDGIAAAPVEGSTAGRIIEQMRKAGWKYDGKTLPPVDMDEDDAATA